jgi:hypothetical protein
VRVTVSCVGAQPAGIDGICHRYKALSSSEVPTLGSPDWGVFGSLWSIHVSAAELDPADMARVREPGVHHVPALAYPLTVPLGGRQAACDGADAANTKPSTMPSTAGRVRTITYPALT